MKDADLFRQYAKEVMRWSSESKSENEKRTLIELACTWAQAALLSERGADSISVPRDGGEATSQPRS